MPYEPPVPLVFNFTTAYTPPSPLVIDFADDDGEAETGARTLMFLAMP